LLLLYFIINKVNQKSKLNTDYNQFTNLSVEQVSENLITSTIRRQTITTGLSMIVLQTTSLSTMTQNKL